MVDWIRYAGWQIPSFHRLKHVGWPITEQEIHLQGPPGSGLGILCQLALHFRPGIAACGQQKDGRTESVTAVSTPYYLLCRLPQLRSALLTTTLQPAPTPSQDFSRRPVGDSVLTDITTPNLYFLHTGLLPLQAPRQSNKTGNFPSRLFYTLNLPIPSLGFSDLTPEHAYSISLVH